MDIGDEYYEDRIYIQEGWLEFSRLANAKYDALPASTRGAVAIDVNHDGQLDLVTGGGTIKDQYRMALT